MDAALAQNILDRLQAISDQMTHHGHVLATCESQIEGINRRLDILNGRVGKGEGRIASLETAEAVRDGRAQLAAWFWGIVGGGIVVLAEVMLPKLLNR